MRKLSEYALYKGDTFIFAGTRKECADYLGVKESTIRFYMTPGYKRRKYADNRVQVYKLEDEE